MKKDVKPLEYLSPKEAAKALCMSVRKLMELATTNHNIPYYRINARVIRFNRADIESFMESLRIEAVNY